MSDSPDRNVGLSSVTMHETDRIRRLPVLSVIIPVYNEQNTVAEVIRRVTAAWPDKQVIVVDDCSHDGTAEVLCRCQEQHEFELIRHTRNRGKGAAVRTGLEHARGQFTIIQDADLEYDPDDYAGVLAPLINGHSQIVYGSRYLRRSTAGPRFDLFRIGVSLLNVCVRVIYGVRLSDEATCYKAFQTSVLRAMQLECNGFEFCPEVTAKACRMGLQIQEVPVAYQPRSTAAGKKIRYRDGLTAIRTLWRLRSWRPNSHDGPAGPHLPFIAHGAGEAATRKPSTCEG